MLNHTLSTLNIYLSEHFRLVKCIPLERCFWMYNSWQSTMHVVSSIWKVPLKTDHVTGFRKVDGAHYYKEQTQINTMKERTLHQQLLDLRKGEVWLRWKIIRYHWSVWNAVVICFKKVGSWVFCAPFLNTIVFQKGSHLKKKIPF